MHNLSKIRGTQKLDNAKRFINFFFSYLMKQSFDEDNKHNYQQYAQVYQIYNQEIYQSLVTDQE
jgi:hypothetical protein